MGLVNDGITAWRRFFNSNFRDEERQNGINIILGKTHKEGDIQNSDDDDDE